MQEYRKIEDLSDNEYENLVRDYETTYQPVKALVEKYSLDPLYKIGLTPFLNKPILTEEKCPNCGNQLYRKLKHRGIRFPNFICQKCGHTNSIACTCSLCTENRKKVEEQIRRESDLRKEELRKRDELKRTDINLFLNETTNQDHYYEYEELGLNKRIKLSCICRSLKFINNTNTLHSLESQQNVTNVFPLFSVFENWVKDCVSQGLISIDQNSPNEAFYYENGKINYYFLKVNFRIMLKELNDKEQYVENLEKIRTLDYRWNLKVNDIKELWLDIAYQELLAYTSFKMTWLKIMNFQPSERLTSTLKKLLASGLSVGQVQSLLFSAFAYGFSTNYFKDKNYLRTSTTILNKIYSFSQDYFAGKKNYKAGHRFDLQQSDLSFLFFNIFLGMENIKFPEIEFTTPCSEAFIEWLISMQNRIHLS